jgi:hypothetical protein
LTRFGEHAGRFVFTSARFDHTGELPPEANAGNRFYGRDVAGFIRDGLAGEATRTLADVFRQAGIELRPTE